MDSELKSHQLDTSQRLSFGARKEVEIEYCFPGSLVCKESASSAGAPSSLPGSGRSPGGGSGNPLQYYCLKIPMERKAWWATVYGSQKLNMTK